MLKKNVIIHIIDSLTRGGAETILVDVVNTIKDDYQNIIITFSDKNDFTQELAQFRIINVPIIGKVGIIKAILKLRKILRNQDSPVLIHAHLPLSTFIVRVAKPKYIPLIFSVHSTLSLTLSKSPFLFKCEKYANKNRQTAIFVSNNAKEDYQKVFGTPSRSIVLHNFVADEYFKNKKRNSTKTPLKFVSIGNLKPSKNNAFLINVFSKLKDKNLTLDIFGDGPSKIALMQQIKQLDATNIILRGTQKNLYKLLKDYDCFITSTLHEGFGLAPIEAAAAGLPILISDIEVLREVTNGKAIYFDPQDEQDVTNKIKDIIEGKLDLKTHVNAMKKVVQNYRKSNYIKELKTIYQEVLKSNKN